MSFFGVFLFILGAFCVATATECMPETEKCSKYWVKMLPHTNLIETEDDLNLWCSKQDRFYQCLEDVFLEGKNGNLSYLPTNLLVSKFFARDLCSDGSKNRERLLSNAECINKLNTDFCILPEYLDIVTPDDAIPSTRCSQAEKTFSCIAATIVLNCGFDAGRVYRAMLKITRYSDEVCGIETSDGIPPCEGSYSKSVDREKKLSDIYYGLFHRIGNLLDDEQTDLGYSVSEEPSDHEDEAITEAIKSAIDNLDKNLVSEEFPISEHDTTDSRFPCTKDIKEYKQYMKNPRITEFLKGMLVYNFSGIEYAMYWRQPEFVGIDQVTCRHLLPSYMNTTVFQCRTDYRWNDPDCLSNATAHEKITPEFIRSFDSEIPCDSVVEFGLKPEWKKEMDDISEKRKGDQMTTTSSPVITEAPEVITKSSRLFNLISNTSYSDYYLKNLDMEGNSNFLKKRSNRVIPHKMHMELSDVLSFAHLPERFVPPTMTRILVGNSIFVIIYNFKDTNDLENVTCSRMDECHPSGRGVWKCKWYPRRIETCDTCGQKPSLFDYEMNEKYARPIEHRKLRFETEPSVTDSSSVSESATQPTDEPTVLLFSGDSEAERKLTGDHSENESEINELDFMKDEAYSKDLDSNRVQYNLVSDSDVDNEEQYEILKSIFEDEDMESSPVVYAIEETDMEDDDSEIIISTDSFHDGNIILVSNISDLDETKYTVVSAPPDFTE